MLSVECIFVHNIIHTIVMCPTSNHCDYLGWGIDMFRYFMVIVYPVSRKKARDPVRIRLGSRTQCWSTYFPFIFSLKERYWKNLYFKIKNILKKSGIHLEVMWIKGLFFCRYNTPRIRKRNPPVYETTPPIRKPLTGDKSPHILHVFSFTIDRSELFNNHFNSLV